MQQFYLLVDSADGRLDAGVCRPYLVAVYAELSHEDSFGSQDRWAYPNPANCGELGDWQSHTEGRAAARRLVGNNLAFVSLDDRADNRKPEA